MSLLHITVLNTPGAPFVCEGEIERACLEMKELKLKADDLAIEASRSPLPTMGSLTVFVVASLYSEEAIPKKVRGKLARIIATAIKRTHGASFHVVDVVVNCPDPSQVSTCRRK